MIKKNQYKFFIRNLGFEGLLVLIIFDLIEYSFFYKNKFHHFIRIIRSPLNCIYLVKDFKNTVKIISGSNKYENTFRKSNQAQAQARLRLVKKLRTTSGWI